MNCSEGNPIQDLIRKKSSKRCQFDKIDCHSIVKPIGIRSRQQEKSFRYIIHTASPVYYDRIALFLQRDRLQRRHQEDEDVEDAQQQGGRGLSRHSLRSGNYHPINPNLLFGGRNRSDEDDEEGAAIRKKFVSPVVGSDDKKSARPTGTTASTAVDDQDDVDPRLKSCDPELIAKIEMEIVDSSDPVTFDDIGTLIHEISIILLTLVL